MPNNSIFKSKLYLESEWERNSNNLQFAEKLKLNHQKEKKSKHGEQLRKENTICEDVKIRKEIENLNYF